MHENFYMDISKFTVLQHTFQYGHDLKTEFKTE